MTNAKYAGPSGYVAPDAYFTIPNVEWDEVCVLIALNQRKGHLLAGVELQMEIVGSTIKQDLRYELTFKRYWPDGVNNGTG